MNTPSTTHDARMLNSLRWRLIGPFRGGRVVAVAGDPERPLVFYFGSTGGGVWKTEDAGWIWQNISDGFFRTASVGALAVADADPNVIYAGMGECCIRNNIAHGDGVYRSTDQGRTWESVGLAETRSIARIRVHPRDANLVYVAALGHTFGAHPARGVFRSADGGRSWNRVLFRNDRAGACDLSMDPTNPRILFAAIWEAHRTPWEMSSGGPGSGLFKTTDGGDSWTEITDNPGLPRGIKGRIGVVVSPALPNRVWAVVEAEEGGVFRSDNAGATWTRVNGERELRLRPYYYSHIFADPVDADTVYVANQDLWKSVDGGRTYTKRALPHGDHHDLWIDPKNPQRMVNGSDGGGSVSLNGGDSWSTIYNQPTAELYHVTADNSFPYRVYGAQQDNTTLSLPSSTTEGAITYCAFYDVGGSESGYIAVNPDNPNIIFAGIYGQQGMLTRYDHQTGEVRDITVWPENAAGWEAGRLKYRFQWTFPIVLSPHDPHVLYATGNHVFRTTNEGARWEAISPDLTRNDPTKLGSSGGPLTPENASTEYYCTVFAFCESPVQPGILWAGSDDGLIHISTDNGRTWENVTPAILPEWALISTIEASPHDPATAYVAATRYKLDDLRPYLLKTTDFGKSWQLIANGLPEDLITRVCREDPVRRGLLYAGTETGVVFSVDDGAHWHPLRNGLPTVPVHDLVVKNDELVLATHGRSFWTLDDASPIRQLTEEVRAARIHLFTPRATPRVKVRGLALRTGGPLSYAIAGGLGVTALERDGSPVLLDAGQNPPTGVLVHYYFREKPMDEVKLAFLDDSGLLLREFSSKPVAAPSPSRMVHAAPSTEQVTVPAEQGANRFVWNMRLAGAREIPGVSMVVGSLDGPIVLPGTYRVRLTVGDLTLERSFDIRRDPRLTLTDDDLRAQFDFLVAVRDKITEVHDAVLDLRDIRTQVQYWMFRIEGLPGSGALAGVANELGSALDGIEDALIQSRSETFGGRFQYPVRLNNQLATLGHVTGMGTAAPTDQARELFAELRAKTDAQLDRLAEVKRREVAMFGNALRELGIPPIWVRGRGSRG